MGRFDKTPSGFAQDEVVSAMQKEIRRGREREAVYWALELHDVAPARVWRRLSVCAAEDIGVADPAALLMFEAAAGLWDRARSSHGCETIIALAVVVLARARKNREIDTLTSITKAMRAAGERLEIPEYAVDQHTAAGRRQLKDDAERLVQWIETGQVCTNIAGANAYIEEWLERKAKEKGLTRSQLEHCRRSIRQQYLSVTK